MPTDRLNKNDLRALGAKLGFDLEGDELEAVEAAMAGFLTGFDFVESLPDPERSAPPSRTYQIPEDSENPHGAWVCRTSIREREEGRLKGRTVALKDNIALAGIPMKGGTSFLEDFVPEEDATVARRVLDEGAEIVGKAACEYLSLSAGSHTGASGVVRNPHDADRTAGGSSSGCGALVASGDVDLAIGGDQGGSIRFPASFCGIVGMKPTHGLVPYTGILSIDAHLDHTGPMTASVADNALLLEVLAGSDGLDTRQQEVEKNPYASEARGGISGLRVGVVTEGFPEDTDPGVEKRVREAADQLAQGGAQVETVSIPEHLWIGSAGVPLLILGGFELVRGGGFATHANMPVLAGLPEAFARWPDYADRMPVNVKTMLLGGALLDHAGGRALYAKALRLRAAAMATYDRAMSQLDALLMPTTPVTAPKLPSPDADFLELYAAGGGGIGNTMQFDVTGHPALSVPCGQANSMPVGCMLIGRYWSESTLYRLGAAIEAG
ncbi:MAG: amidase [Myxococcota bacterium]|nr:amidase [Myxococcota bacterium]